MKKTIRFRLFWLRFVPHCFGGPHISTFSVGSRSMIVPCVKCCVAVVFLWLCHLRCGERRGVCQRFVTSHLLLRVFFWRNPVIQESVCEVIQESLCVCLFVCCVLRVLCVVCVVCCVCVCVLCVCVCVLCVCVCARARARVSLCVRVVYVCVCVCLFVCCVCVSLCVLCVCVLRVCVCVLCVCVCGESVCGVCV